MLLSCCLLHAAAASVCFDCCMLACWLVVVDTRLARGATAGGLPPSEPQAVCSWAVCSVWGDPPWQEHDGWFGLVGTNMGRRPASGPRWRQSHNESAPQSKSAAESPPGSSSPPAAYPSESRSGFWYTDPGQLSAAEPQSGDESLPVARLAWLASLSDAASAWLPPPSDKAALDLVGCIRKRFLFA